MGKSQHWRNTKEYRKWRIQVIRRDKVCQICGSIKNRQAHHLNSGSYFKEDRYNPDLGITLCSHCHSYFHNKFIGSYRKKATKKDFERFVKLVNYIKSLKE